VLYGLFQASQNPEKLPISIVASASGVLISFIGGSFLLIYRSILAQSKEYVTVLERINAVGMAVQVIASIPDANADLKEQHNGRIGKTVTRFICRIENGSHRRAIEGLTSGRADGPSAKCHTSSSSQPAAQKNVRSPIRVFR